MDEGSITLAGRTLPSSRSTGAAGCWARLFQDPMRGPPHMTIEENLALAYLRTAKHQHAFFSRTSRADRALFRDQLARAGHGAGGPDGAAGGAAVRRTAAGPHPAHGHAGAPKLLLLDEHTAALDPGTAERCCGSPGRWWPSTGSPPLMVTHNMHQALGWATAP